MPASAEGQPLLPQSERGPDRPRITRTRAVLTVLACVLLAIIVFGLATQKRTSLPDDPLERAHALLRRSPLVDTHIDTPIAIREWHALNLSAIDLRRHGIKHVDIPRLRAGGAGGVFWSVYVDCPGTAGFNESADFTTPSFRVRDTLEQIDITRQMIDAYPDDFVFADSATDIRRAHAAGRIAGLMGIEGAHQLGQSLGVLRQYRALGVRYMTLTHSCHNAVADSCGYQGLPPLHHGISAFGREVVREMNRIGMIVDASHTSLETAHDALSLSRAPVLFSHSNAQVVYNVSRNVDSSIFERIRRADELGDRSESGVLAGDAVVSATAAGYFVANGTATLADLADHIDAIGRLAGRSHVGIGSDFDGVPLNKTPRGFEDVSKYPELVAEMIRRGWSDDEIAGLIGGNVLRVLDAADRVQREMADERPSAVLYAKRRDLPKAHPREL